MQHVCPSQILLLTIAGAFALLASAEIFEHPIAKYALELAIEKSIEFYWVKVCAIVQLRILLLKP
tara:strand:+ start:2501 stop:2695 length:195 start_codon:yes stop_codon:yes gene_type:complete